MSQPYKRNNPSQKKKSWNIPLVVPGRETLGKYPHFNSFHVHIFLNVKMTTFMMMIIYHKQEMHVGWLSHILPGAASTPWASVCLHAPVMQTYLRASQLVSMFVFKTRAGECAGHMDSVTLPGGMWISTLFLEDNLATLKKSLVIPHSLWWSNSTSKDFF